MLKHALLALLLCSTALASGHPRKETEWGSPYTVQHSHCSNKSRWAVWTKDGVRYEHILIWEKHRGRKLPKDWVIHHKDTRR